MLGLIATTDPEFSARASFANFRTKRAASYEELAAAAEDFDFDILIIDEHLCDCSGIVAVKRLRAAKVETPIILLSASEGLGDIVDALGSGADDCLRKPFDSIELLARMMAIVRRSNGHAQSTIAIDDLAVNLTEQRVSIGGVGVYLTAQEFKMIELLAIKLGKMVTKEMFMNHLYSGRDEPEIKIIDVYICKVRRKLELASGNRNYIETIWGRGYILRRSEGCPPPPLHRPAGASAAIIQEGKRLADAA